MTTDRRQQLRAIPNLTLSHRLTLTPSLLKKIELLTLSKLELQELVTRELTENPFLEDYTELEQQEASLAQASMEKKETVEPVVEKAKPVDDIDFKAFFSTYTDSGFDIKEYEEIEKPSFETFLSKPTSLYDHLVWQLGFAEVSQKIKDIAHYIIGNLDENGYLTIPLEEVCQQIECTMEEAADALRLVQSFDPIGVASRDLRECLLIQLRSLGGEGTLAEKIIDECLPLIEGKKFKEICNKLNCKLDEVKQALDVIKHLIPKPGLKYNPCSTQYVQPEVHVTKVDDDYVVMLNEDGMPMLRLNSTYRELLKGGAVVGEAKEFLREKLRSAIDLLRSINQRRQTISRVCECIVKRQRAFLEVGMEQLQPMLIKDVAAELGVHPSTISRVVTNKYIHTPQGVMELRKFFTTGIEKTDGQKLSIIQLKHKVKQIIDHEDRQNPYSDEEIVEILEKENIIINRRTIAKYREQMKIAGSRERKASYSM